MPGSGNLIYAITNSPKIQGAISFLSSSELQREFLPVKLVFIFFTAFFLGVIIYFYIKSSYLQTHVFQDIVEFLFWKPYGLGKMLKKWRKILSRVEKGTESEYKLAIIEADDFLSETLGKHGYEGKTFEERINKVEKAQLSNAEEILKTHKIRNSIVYDPDYKLDLNTAKKILDVYQQAVQNIENL